MEADSCVPPGFRFHPTEEELVGYYLARKVASQKIDVEVIADIDLYKIEPWDLQDSCKLGYEEQTEWYFFSHKDKKYPSGTRTNRATIAGFWKATGRDKAVFSKRKLIGMRKTLVFYKGRAPNGRKTDWIMHEYRLETSEHAPPQDEGWVVCRAFRKRNPHPRPSIEPWDHARYLGDNTQAMYRAFSLDFAGPKELADSYQRGNFPEPEFDYKSKVDIEQNHSNQFLHLPQLNSTAIPTLLVTRDGFEADVVTNEEKEQRNNFGTQLADWRELDMLLASQLSETPCSTSISPLLYLGTEDLTQNQLNGFLTTLPNS